MHRWFLLVAVVGLGGCANGLVVRQTELARWVGKPEVELVQVMGAPSRMYETDGMKFLTYEDKRTEIVPGTPFYAGYPVYGAGGFPPAAINLVCDTTFTIGGGVVRAFSLRGNACNDGAI